MRRQLLSSRSMQSVRGDRDAHVGWLAGSTRSTVGGLWSA